MQTAIYFFLSLFPLVVVHELGHFLLAKLNGVHVEEFGLGFPPRAARLFTHGGTEYTFNWLPLGGFVRLAGEEDPTVPGAFAAKAKRVRAAVLAAGPGANFLFSAIILSVIALWGIPEPVPGLSGVAVSSVSEDMPAAAAGLTASDVIVEVNGQVLRDLGDAETDSHSETTYFQKITEGSAGQAMQLHVVGFDESFLTDNVDGAQTEPFTTPWLDGERVVSPGDHPRLRAGDILLGVTSNGETAVWRGLQERDVTVVPAEVPADDGATKGQIGIMMTTATVSVSLGPVQAAAWGVQRTGQLMVALVGALGEMVRSGEGDISGPVGIARISRDSAQAGPLAFLSFMAILSLNLGVINLLPIPALDGGRLLFIAVEAIRGRRVSPAREQLVHLIGFLLVIGLMVVVTVYEVVGAGGTP